MSESKRRDAPDPLVADENVAGNRIGEAENRELALRSFIMFAVAGDLLADFGTRMQRLNTEGPGSQALAELVGLGEQVAEAVAAVDRWEAANTATGQPGYDRRGLRERYSTVRHRSSLPI